MGHDQAHGEAGGVPAAGNQPAEGATASKPGVYVDRLGVELPGEGDDLRLAHTDLAVLIHRAGRIVLEVAVVDAHREVGLAQRARRAVSPGGLCHYCPASLGLTASYSARRPDSGVPS